MVGAPYLAEVRSTFGIMMGRLAQKHFSLQLPDWTLARKPLSYFVHIVSFPAFSTSDWEEHMARSLIGLV